jgi:hypothetical protein
VADDRRLNVAITRAKRGLVVLGNRATLSNDATWRSWFKFVDKHGLAVRAADLGVTVPQGPALMAPAEVGGARSGPGGRGGRSGGGGRGRGGGRGGFAGRGGGRGAGGEADARPARRREPGQYSGLNRDQMF